MVFLVLIPGVACRTSIHPFITKERIDRKVEKMMKLGTATSVLFQYSLQDAIPLIARAGYEGVDIWGGRPHVYRHDFTNQELKQLRQTIDNYGLLVPSFMPAFYRYPHSLSNPNPKVREDSMQYMKECVENAVALGAGIVLVVPDHSLFGQTREDSLKRMIDSLDGVARFAAQFDGLMLGIEILYFDETDLVNTADDVVMIINQLGMDNIGAVLDTGTLNLSKEPPQAILPKLGSLLLQVHVNDNEGSDRQENLIPGEGTYDFRNLIRNLKDFKYSGFLSAELSKEYAADPEPALRTTAHRLRRWIDE
jgi:protein FrlC